MDRRQSCKLFMNVQQTDQVRVGSHWRRSAEVALTAPNKTRMCEDECRFLITQAVTDVMFPLSQLCMLHKENHRHGGETGP